MGRRKEERYRFYPADQEVKIPDNIKQHDILMIVNANDGIIIANQLDPGKGFTCSHTPTPVTDDADFIYSTDGYTTITLEYDTTGMSSTDELTVYIDDERHGLKVRPYNFGTDAIERMRVANPQSLIDADFEYGLQNTKWQSIGLNRNIPSFYEFAGQPLVASEISSGGESPYSTITVTVASGAPSVGTPVSVNGVTNELAEGLFVVITSNDSTSFTYQARGNIASGSIYTSYSLVKEGGIFAGAALPMTGINSTSVGGASTTYMTVNFSSNHGLIPGSPITVVDSAAGSQAHEGNFFVNIVDNGTQFKYDAGQTVGSATTANIKVYAKNDAQFIHRPFDGGVRCGNFFPIHGLEAKRQSKRYFRYQSGKGILFTTGSLLSPTYDIDDATYTGTDPSIEITYTTSEIHGLQSGAIVKIAGLQSDGYNGTFTVKDVNSANTFVVDQGATAPTVTPAVLGQDPKVSGINWTGSAIRTGLFDDENGVFWEYDGNTLYAVKRSSTQQLAGVVGVALSSSTVTGTNTRFNQQIDVGDKVVIKGQTHLVVGIASDTQLSISPEYRGSTSSGNKMSIVKEIRVRQNQFNYDRIDGVNSPSGYNFDVTKMQMYGIQYSWYGAGFIDFMIRGPLGEFITVHRIVNNNVNTEAYMRSGNLPARYEVSNFTARSELAIATGVGGTTSLTLKDATDFPTPQAGYPNYVLVGCHMDGEDRQEIMSYTGKSGDTLTGVTTATSYTLYLAGQDRTFAGVTTTTLNHTTDSGVILLNTTCSPTISHWGSAVIMDGGFDEDNGYLFNLATSVTVAGNTTQTVLLFRAAPSVSNTIPGNLGDREVINRSQIRLKEIEVNNNSSRNIEIGGVLNASNLSGASWNNANSVSLGSASTFQPSFAQYDTTFTTVPTDGEILFRFLSVSGTTRFNLDDIKEVQNSVIGGNSTYPDGPEVLALVIANNNAQSASLDISLKWTEAQA